MAAGGGRYLILHLKRLNQLAVLDVSAAKVIHYLPAPAGIPVCRRNGKLVLILPDKKLIERWSLETFEKEASSPLPVDFTPGRAAMGSQSSGPLLLSGPTGAALIDLDTLKKMSIVLEGANAELTVHVMEIEAGPDGKRVHDLVAREHTEEPSHFGLLSSGRQRQGGIAVGYDYTHHATPTLTAAQCSPATATSIPES